MQILWNVKLTKSVEILKKVQKKNEMFTKFRDVIFPYKYGFPYFPASEGRPMWFV